ncbi:hypothetical protein EJ04DRAFT_514876 [Polyplosphaeria fusca]|uniref:Uncharacterized protein n=1 Tax=Polyplosphaeria fusca TaxID=682080 RepID=A0A9P4QTG2_9PLEO|nr:hypothetical protein EJ04DRAFT_514876 [Polyplosphaeria fusca]
MRLASFLTWAISLTLCASLPQAHPDDNAAPLVQRTVPRRGLNLYYDTWGRIAVFGPVKMSQELWQTFEMTQQMEVWEQAAEEQAEAVYRYLLNRDPGGYLHDGSVAATCRPFTVGPNGYYEGSVGFRVRSDGQNVLEMVQILVDYFRGHGYDTPVQRVGNAFAWVLRSPSNKRSMGGELEKRSGTCSTKTFDLRPYYVDEVPEPVETKLAECDFP